MTQSKTNVFLRLESVYLDNECHLALGKMMEGEKFFFLNSIHKAALILESESFLHIHAVAIISPTNFF